MVGVIRALWVPLLQLLPQQGHPEQGAQGHCTAQKGSWCSDRRTSCAPVCAHSLRSWHRAPLTEPGSGLWHPPSGIYRH